MGAALSCTGGGRNLLNSAGNGDSDTIREVTFMSVQNLAERIYCIAHYGLRIAARP